jgi:hypothetical protein
VRFTLSHLLLLFPAYFLGLFFAHAVYLFGGARTHYADTSAWKKVLQAQLRLEASTYERVPMDESSVNQWLTGRLPAGHPVSQQLGTPPGLDPWGNSLVCRNRDVAMHDCPFGVNSFGRDGKSKSLGDDPDDLNSWNDKCGAVYATQRSKAQRLELGLLGVLFAPLGFALLYSVGRVWDYIVYGCNVKKLYAEQHAAIRASLPPEKVSNSASAPPRDRVKLM